MKKIIKPRCIARWTTSYKKDNQDDVCGNHISENYDKIVNDDFCNHCKDWVED